MSDNAINIDRVFDLMGRICDGSVSESEIAEMDAYLLADQQSRDRYMGYCWMHVALTMEMQVQQAVQQVHQQIHKGFAVPAASGYVTAEAKALASPAPIFPASLWHSAVTYFSSGWPLAYLIATVLFTIVGLVAAFTYVSRPEQSSIATLSVPTLPSEESRAASVGLVTGMYGCKWAKGVVPLLPNGVVSVGRQIKLDAGLMEITYHAGAKVILQGPVTYRVESPSGGFLSIGKMTARLETKAEGGRRTAENKSEIRNPKSETISQSPTLQLSKFVVRTPTATVTDLGTEFGIEVDRSGETTSHVFRGSIRVQRTIADGQTETGGRVLGENETVRVEGVAGSRQIVTLHTFTSSRFVRELPKHTIRTIDLLDIVAGGDGTGHRREHGIDPTTGMEDPMYVLGNRGGDRQYHRIAEWHGRQLIDGVFTPDGRAGPVQLDSAGHTYNAFPPTRGTVYGSIWPRVADISASYMRNNRSPVYAMGRGDQYMPDNRGLLGMCSNAGITFDIEAIRKAHPAVRPVRFRAVAGLACRGDIGLAEVWVFVDGRLEFHRNKLRYCDGPVPIDVQLKPDNRFLTLVSTDGGNDLVCDWIVFGDPRLELDKAEAE